MIVYGRHPVIDLIESGKEIEKIIIQNNIERDFLMQVQKLCKKKGIPLQHVPKEKLNRTTRENHQGIIATASLIQYQQVEDIVPYLFDMQKVPLLLILDNITDVRNFGSIAVCKVKKLAETIGYLQNNGIMVYASSLQAEKKLHEMDFQEPSAIILGSEDHGVQKYIIKSVDDTFIIPQVGITDSLNVSVANGVILYEVVRQRGIG